MWRSYRLGDGLLLVPSRRALEREGRPVPIPARALDVLAILVENRDRVVTKEELLSEVWPGLAVDDNNLNQSISALRKIFGDTRREARAIATVPNVGYRFVGAVEESGESVAAPAPAPASAPPRLEGRRWIGAIAAVAGFAALAGPWAARSIRPTPVSVPLVFENLSPGHHSDWLSMTLPELLAPRFDTEPSAGPASGMSLRGSFAVTGPTLKLEISLLDATGNVRGSADEAGQIQDFLALAAKAGHKLAQLTGRKPRPQAGVDSMRSLAAARTQWLASDLLAALKSLRRAASDEPNNPLILAALARTLGDLGRTGEARALTRRAWDLSAALSPAERLEVEALHWAETGEWSKAIESRRRLAALNPESFEHGWRLASVLFDARQGDDAARALAGLARLPESYASDPRIPLLEARVHGLAGRMDSTRDLARRSAKLAQARGARLIHARAKLLESGALLNLGELENARSLRHEARRLCEELGDRVCAASCWRVEGNAMVGLGRWADAEQSYRKAAEHVRLTGRAAEQMNVLTGLSAASLARGDFAAAEASSREAISLGEMENAVPVPALLNGLAGVHRVQGRLGDASELFRRALALSRGQPPDRESEAHAQAGLAETAARSGNHAEAVRWFRGAIDSFRRLANPEKLGLCLSAYARVLIELGDRGAAAKLLDQAHAAFPSPHVTLGRAELARAGGDHAAAIRLAGMVPPTSLGARFEAALIQARSLRALRDANGEAKALAEAAEIAKSWREPRLLFELDAASRSQAKVR